MLVGWSYFVDLMSLNSPKPVARASFLQAETKGLRGGSLSKSTGDWLCPFVGRLGILGSLLFAYIVLLPVQLKTDLGFRLAPSDGVLGVALLLSFARLKFKRGAWSLWHLGVLCIFSLGTLISGIRDGYLGQYALVQKDIGILMFFATYAVVTNAATSWSKIRWFLRAFVVSAALYNLLALAGFLLSWLGILDFPWLNYGRFRLSGMLIDPNAYGSLLLVVYTIHVANQHNDASIGTGFLDTFLASTLVLGILLTFSRSAWLGLAAVFIVSSVVRPRLALRIAVVAGFAIAIAFLALGRESRSFIYTMATRPPGIEIRLDTTAEAVDMFAQSPIFGIGVGRFFETRGRIIHNTPLWILTEFGLVGFAIFVGFVSSVLYRGWRAFRLAPDSERALVLGLVLAHVAMLGLSFGIEAFYQRHWWIVMALIGSAYSVEACRYYPEGMLTRVYVPLTENPR